MKKNSVTLYIILAMGITWLLWIPSLLLVSAKGYPLPTIDYLMANRSFELINGEHFWMVLSFSLAVYGPLLAGLIVAWREGGAGQVRAWFAPVLNWRVKPLWVIVILLIPLLIFMIPFALGWLPGLVKAKEGYLAPSLLFVMGLFLYQCLTSGLGEEPGWRGFLLPRWQAQLGSEKAAWWAGLVWGVWHFPFTIYFTLRGLSGLDGGAQMAVLIPSLVGQVMSLIGMTFLYAWLMDKTKSLLVAILFHAMSNTASAVLVGSVTADPMIGLVAAAMPWLVVIIFEKTALGRVVGWKTA